MIKRGTFVGMAAAGAAAGARVTLANAKGVPENDPAIVVERAGIRGPDVTMPAYAARPRNAVPRTPGVVVVMHIWGVDESIRETVRRLAKAGFAAVAPDLYARLGAPAATPESDYKIFVPFAQKLNSDQVDGDLRGTALWLKRSQPDAAVGVMGFCMGGGVALRQAVKNDDVFAADVVFYGRVSGIDPAAVRLPVLGNYGAKDTGIPVEDVRAFQKGLRVPNDFEFFSDAGHAFFDNTRPSYVADAAEVAWNRTVAFFTKYLRR